MPSKKVKLANGEYITTNKMVSPLQWYCQGHTLASNMIVLDMHPYDAILGYDWLETHSAMHCDWASRTLEFSYQGRQVKLQGFQPSSLAFTSISTTKVYNSVKGNDV
jgi:hypothetical protein